MTSWWVSHNQTYAHEVRGGYLWSPVTNSNGSFNYFYESMTRARPGDTVFSFAESKIMAVGRVTKSAEPSVKPDFGSVGENWSQFGWLVQVEFVELERPVRPKYHMNRLGPLLPKKYSPLRSSGVGNQNVYLAELTPALTSAIRAILGDEVTAIEGELRQEVGDSSDIEDDLMRRLKSASIHDTEKQQLINARRGQGLFRNNVRLVERRCRVTGVHQLHHLRASHIKPWRDSDNTERLDGSNGLLLAPHVDHLFDRGYISFEDSGDLLVSPRLESDVIDAWSIDTTRNVGSFAVDQEYFLGFHREHVLVQD